MEKIIEDFKGRFDLVKKEKEDIVCNLSYYKNVFLMDAMMENQTLQCIIRSYLERLMTSFEYTDRLFDIWEINQMLIYLKTFQDRSTLNYNNQKFKELDETFPISQYMIKTFSNRFKTLLSVIYKIRKREVTEETLLDMRQHLFEYPEFKKLNEDKRVKIQEYWQECWDKNNQKTPVKDLVGYKEVVISNHNSREDSQTIPCVYEILEHTINFCKKNGFSVYKVKDYIQTPKEDTGYQSIHVILDILGTLSELQIRNGWMEEEAEYGSWNHEGIYKNTRLGNFLTQFITQIAKSTKRLTHFEGIGILKILDLFHMPVCQTADREWARTPEDLKKFPDIIYIKKIVDNSTQFSRVV